MKCLTISLLAIAAIASVSAQQQMPPNHPVTDFSQSSNNSSPGSSLPVEKIGVDDLVGITVYDAPELTRNVRVGTEGEIRLPMIKQHIHAAGLYPGELETAISAALIKENVLVDPIVTVSVVEYRSRPITVVGAVQRPLTFQATGTVTLLDAMSQAGGLTQNAGAEILVSNQPAGTSDRSMALIQRIPVRELLSGQNPELNLHLQGGEEIRVPEAGRIFVVGDVSKPGSFYITDGSESSVLQALALSEGLKDTFYSHDAYIYRVEAGSTSRSEIPISLKKILTRKAPDVSLMANDILYVPNATGLRATMKVLETTVGVGAAIGAASIYAFH
jgi:polysaccharide export outer membrane protein